MYFNLCFYLPNSSMSKMNSVSKIAFLFLCLMHCIGFQSQAQTQSTPDLTDEVLKRAVIRKIPSYEFTESFPEQILLKMAYRTTEIVNAADIKLVSRVKVTKVELVYTLYPNDGTFQNGKQMAINKERLSVLYKELPGLFKPEVKWEFVQQTKCSSTDEAKIMFHGFVIHYKMPGATGSSSLSPKEDQARIGLPNAEQAKKKQG